MTLLEQIIPAKYGNKQRFETHEVLEILAVKDAETLYSYDATLKPIRTTSRVRIYTRQNIEAHLKRLND